MQPATRPAHAIFPTLLALIAALAAAACAVNPTGTRGHVVGLPGATVCADRNANARCDAGEPQTRADASGGFTVPGDGGLVAESNGLVLRAPAGAALSPVSTELVALMEADGSSLSCPRA